MRIGVFCSGGDAPGMNACVRAIVRTADRHGLEVVGIQRGFQGLIDRKFHGAEGPGPVPLLTPRAVSGWSRHGGAFLYSSRSDEFRTDAGQEKAIRNLREAGIDALIPIGGDGTFQGCLALAQRWDGPIIGCPGTIDNDLPGTDYTIGFSTAVQTAVDGLDKVRDTAHSHERMFLIEVMGRHSGYLAIHTALAGGAEAVAIPETKTDIPAIIATLNQLKAAGRESVMMVVAEGDEEGGAETINRQLQEHGCPFKTRIVVLGHLQRGGTPTPEDRYRATRLGYDAVHALQAGRKGMMAGLRGDESVLVPFEVCCAGHHEIPMHLLQLLETVSG